MKGFGSASAALTSEVESTTTQEGVRDGEAVPFSEIWKVVAGSRAWYGDYPMQRSPRHALLEAAHARLSASDGALGKSFVYEDESGLLGHMSGLRYYSRTWVVQHLAVLPGFHRHKPISRDLIDATVRYAARLSGIEYVRFFWHCRNRFPARVGDRTSAALAPRGKSQLRHFHHLRLESPRDFVEQDGLPTVRQAQPSDLRWLEAHHREHGDLVDLASNDWEASEVKLGTVSGRYAALGLTRGREVFVIDGERGPLALAFAETATPGLHWGEFLNGFSLLVPDPEHPRADEARRALVQLCVEVYRQFGRTSVIALVQEDSVPVVEAAGFQHCGRFGEFTFHSSLIRPWLMAFESLFSRLRDVDGG